MNSGIVLAGNDGFTTMTFGTYDAGDRRDVVDEIEIQLFVERRIDRVRRHDQEQSVAIGWRTHDCFGGNVAAGSRTVLDDERLTEPFREPLTYQARRDVAAASGGKPTTMRTGRDG